MCCGGRTLRRVVAVRKTRFKNQTGTHSSLQSRLPATRSKHGCFHLRASRAIFALCSLIAAQGGFAAAQAADIGSCLTKAGVENSCHHSTWAVDTEAWNSRVSPVPSAVAFPKTEEEVSAALKCALRMPVKVTALVATARSRAWVSAATMVPCH
ncbi:FAD-binding, type 2, subdomain 1 [Phytophthora cactorum]|nr:FAD-binding, type 2, subdomain 1 [Phytophthora cactorum]